MRTIRALGVLILGLIMLSGVALAIGAEGDAASANDVFLPLVSRPSVSADTPTATNTSTPTHTATATSTSTSTPTNTSTPTTVVTTYDGDWSGTTSQSKAISFTVRNNNLIHLVFSYSLPNCGVTGTITTTLTPGKPLTGDTFSITSNGAGPISISYALNGSFSSASAASGTLHISYSRSYPYTPCSTSADTTWSATKSQGGVALPDSLPAATPTATPTGDPQSSAAVLTVRQGFRMLPDQMRSTARHPHSPTAASCRAVGVSGCRANCQAVLNHA